MERHYLGNLVGGKAGKKPGATLYLIFAIFVLQTPTVANFSQ
jgi:hypothetical protein